MNQCVWPFETQETKHPCVELISFLSKIHPMFCGPRLFWEPQTPGYRKRCLRFLVHGKRIPSMHAFGYNENVPIILLYYDFQMPPYQMVQLSMRYRRSSLCRRCVAHEYLRVFGNSTPTSTWKTPLCFLKCRTHPAAE